MKPLQGFDKEEQPPVQLNFKAYFDGSYQNYLTEHAKRNTGFREFFIRSYNQVAYSCFGKITNENIVEGRDHELYLKMYLDDITGKMLQAKGMDVEGAKTTAQKNVQETLRLIDTLKQHGTVFLFVFAPSKTGVYPDKMPKHYRDNISDFSLQEYYIDLFKENDIPHIDFLNYFRTIKDTVTYPLYTRTGTHWAQSTMPKVVDSMLRKIETVSGLSLSSVQVDSLNLTTDYPIMDAELEKNCNLLFPFPKPALPNPAFSLIDTIGKERPNLLIIGDSYSNQLIKSCFGDAFNQWDLWIYNLDLYSSRSHLNGTPLKSFPKAAETLNNADIVLAVFTTPMFYNYMFGFPETAHNLYEKSAFDAEESLQATIMMIKANLDWMRAIEEQAKQKGITTEENLIINARYVLEHQVTE